MKRFAALILSVTAMSACTPSVETHVNSIGGMAGNPLRAYSMADIEDASPELLLAQRLVAEQLAAQNYVPSSAPIINVEVTLAQRTASLGLSTGSTLVSPAVKKKASAKCANLDVRLGVTITRLSDGKQSYRASASEVHCNPALKDVLPVLVEATLADLSKAYASGGDARAYVIKRKLR
jgi:hypothetical protein